MELNLCYHTKRKRLPIHTHGRKRSKLKKIEPVMNNKWENSLKKYRLREMSKDDKKSDAALEERGNMWQAN